MSCNNGSCGGCGGGCHSSETPKTITLTLADGKELVCAILSIFPVNEKNYIAVYPVDESEEQGVYIYGFERDEAGAPILRNIDSDEEYEAVADAFDQIMENTLDDEE